MPATHAERGVAFSLLSDTLQEDTAMYISRSPRGT